jgi:hypothetical protein
MTDSPKSDEVPHGLRRLRHFALPDALSLKVVFDNLRNYLICGALMVAINAVAANQSPAQLFVNWPALAKGLVFILLGANIYQSWIIVDELETKFVRFVVHVGPHRGKLLQWTVRGLLVLFWIPLVIAAYQFVPALVRWAIAGGKVNAL